MKSNKQVTNESELMTLARPSTKRNLGNLSKPRSASTTAAVKKLKNKISPKTNPQKPKATKVLSKN